MVLLKNKDMKTNKNHNKQNIINMYVPYRVKFYAVIFQLRRHEVKRELETVEMK